MRMLLAVVCIGMLASAMRPLPSVTIPSPIRTQLVAEWNSTDPYQLERLYCLRYEEKADPLSFVIVEMQKAKIKNPTPVSIGSFRCPRSFKAILHTHPPSVCKIGENGWLCYIDAFREEDCHPSATDLRTLDRDRMKFSIVQCGPTALAVYFAVDSILYPETK